MLPKAKQLALAHEGTVSEGPNSKHERTTGSPRSLTKPWEDRPGRGWTVRRFEMNETPNQASVGFNLDVETLNRS